VIAPGSADMSIPELSIVTWPWGSATTANTSSGLAAIARCTSIRSVMRRSSHAWPGPPSASRPEGLKGCTSVTTSGLCPPPSRYSSLPRNYTATGLLIKTVGRFPVSHKSAGRGFCRLIRALGLSRQPDPCGLGSPEPVTHCPSLAHFAAHSVDLPPEPRPKWASSVVAYRASQADPMSRP
jgi:hypothetical protein